MNEEYIQEPVTEVTENTEAQPVEENEEGIELTDTTSNQEETKSVKTYTEEREVKSIGKGMTFSRNLVGRSDVAKGVLPLSDNIARKMREKNIKCNTVSVHIKDTDLKTISRQKTLDTPTYLAKDIYDVAMKLLEENWNLSEPIRMITVTGSNFTPAEFGGQVTALWKSVRSAWSRKESQGLSSRPESSPT